MVETQDSCVDTAMLQQLLLGMLPREQATDLEVHVLACHRCGERLAGIQAEDTLVAAAHARPTKPDWDDGGQLQRLVDRLCRLPMPTMASASEPLPAGEGLTVEALDELRRFLAPAASPNELGRMGGYGVLKVLGSGGMGIVLEAEDAQLGRRVALKVMKPTLAVSLSARTRFLREARAAAAIQHDNVVTIYQVGEHDGLPYLAMQLLDGEPLSRRLGRDSRQVVGCVERTGGKMVGCAQSQDHENADACSGPVRVTHHKSVLHPPYDVQAKLPPAETIRIGRQIAAGLAAAHARNVVHRDIKPDNIWLEREGDRVKILDFGLAHVADNLPRLTQSGAVAGTPAYMAPEQIANESVDPRADLFSLGCVLYEMCTGRRAFPGSNVAATLIAVAQQNPPAPRQVDPDVPKPLSDLVMKLIEKDPCRRCQTADAVLAALAACQPSSPRAVGGRSRGAVPAIILAGAFLAVLAVTIIYVKTGAGTLVLEVNPSDVRVTIDGENITLRSPRDEIDVRVGGHDLAVSKDGFKTFTRAFEISRGRKVEVSARLEPSEVPIKTGQPAPAAAPATAGVISFGSSNAMIDWVRRDAAAGPDSPLIHDLDTFVENQQRDARGFLFLIGRGLMKSNNLTIVAAHNGRHFACQYPDGGDFPEMVAASMAGVKNVERTTDAKLIALNIAHADDLDPNQEVHGWLELESLCDKQAKYGVRLTCCQIVSIQPIEWTPAKIRGVERIEFRELPQDSLDRQGPMLVFVELCLFPQRDGEHYVIASDPLPALVHVRQRPKR